MKRRGRPPAQRAVGRRGAYNCARSIRSEAHGDLKPTRTPNETVDQRSSYNIFTTTTPPPPRRSSRRSKPSRARPEGGVIIRLPAVRGSSSNELLRTVPVVHIRTGAVHRSTGRRERKARGRHDLGPERTEVRIRKIQATPSRPHRLRRIPQRTSLGWHDLRPELTEDLRRGGGRGARRARPPDSPTPARAG